MADISKIKLPSGNEYDIKDAVAREMISGGISFIISWTATDYASTTAPTAAKLATIPEGAEVNYNSGAGTATGTLTASSDTKAKFYLIYSKTQAGNLDTYNEYVTVENGTNYFWEKIGDTQIDLSNVVTDVSLSKQTDTVIGTDATFTITQPTIALATDTTSGTGKVQVATGISSASASGTGVAWNSKDQKTVLTGVQVTTQPTVTLTANAATGTGRLKYVEDVTGGSTSPTKVHLSATASGGAVSASGDNVTAVTGVSTSKLATTTVTGVSGSTNITPVESRSSQTTATGAGTASTTNTDWLKSISVSNEVLTIGAATMNTQTTYSAGAPRASLAVPTAASSATTVATGSVSSTGGGATVATGSSGTDTVLGTASSFSVTNPSITISTSGTTGPEVVGDVSDITVSPTYKYMSGSASGTAVGANGTATVVGSSSTFTVTDPTVSVTPSTTYVKGTASGANTAWNSKDSVTVLKSTTDVSVTKGSV
jgi:hypothetical protein